MNNSTLTSWDYIRSTATVLVFSIVFAIATPFLLLLLLLSAGHLTNFIIEYIAPLMMKPVLATAGIRFSVIRHGPPLKQPVVYIINHRSTIDLITILALGLPGVRFVAKWELQYNPFFFLLGNLTGQVFIKRQQSERAVERLKMAYGRIKQKGLSVLLAPEGSRKHQGVIGPFKKGPFRMAMDLNYPVVPIYFRGTDEISTGGSLFGKPGRITAHIHTPIDTSAWKLETLEDHIHDVRQRYVTWAGRSG